MESSIDRLQDDWATEIVGRRLKIEDDLSAEKVDSVFDTVENIREFIDGRNLVFELDHQAGSFEYQVLWETSGDVTINDSSDNGADADRLFGQDEAQTAIRSLRSDSVSSRDRLEEDIRSLVETGSVDCQFQYMVDGSHVDEYVQSQLDQSCCASYYFEKSDVISDIQGSSFEELKELFYCDQGKRLFVIRNLDQAVSGPEVGYFPPERLGETDLNSFFQRDSYIDDQHERIRRECAIDRFDDQYLPPDYMKLDSSSQSGFIDQVRSLLRPYRLASGILGVSNVSRVTDDGWQVRINGRRVIESDLLLNNKKEGLTLEESAVDDGLADADQETVESFIELFNWIYSSRTTDRISVFRNIATLYSTTVSGMITEIGDIEESVRSNFEFYIRDSIEEFVEVQQDVTEYVFNTHRELSDIRRGLANNLNRDLFRMVAYVAITWAGIISQLSGITAIQTALTASLIPVFVYISLGLRTAYSLSQQFQATEDGREQYYSMYENRIDENTFNGIKQGDGSDNMKRQFKIDLWIYYVLFTLMLGLCVYAIVDLTWLDGPLSGVIESIVN
ncbi:hypothetical protein [Natrialba sp. PRR66]|uniref:hypothetical protein n=1 Tax=Natrialba sp. PRR66 TaxID=3098146 RepID=UPI002B1CEC0F|nr:hypothetical protein [Natrialba sp. PRR66]